MYLIWLRYLCSPRIVHTALPSSYCNRYTICVTYSGHIDFFPIKAEYREQCFDLFTPTSCTSFSMAPTQPSTEQNFRANLSQFRWARGVTDDSQPQQQNSNPFSRFYNSVAGDYVPLRSSERSNEEEAWFALSRWERYIQIKPWILFKFD